jgi:proline iminopeptidase
MSSVRTPFPVASDPNAETMLAVGDNNQLYVREYGNPSGIPVAVCHGGPGAGCQPDHAGYFDPEKYRIILFDQRGAGRSLPSGCSAYNKTKFLLSDMEKIREHFKVDQWVLFGGSWGSTLALLYAEAYPNRVSGLILRGVFLARDKDCKMFYDDNSPAALCNPEAWNKFKLTIERLAANHKKEPELVLVHTLLNSDNAELRQRTAEALDAWESHIAYFNPSVNNKSDNNEPLNINPYLIEIDYTLNRCYIEENQILKNINTIPHVPIYIIHGKGDFICPQYQAYELTQALKKIGHEINYQETLAGHAGSEENTLAAVLNATNAMGIVIRDEKSNRLRM